MNSLVPEIMVTNQKRVKNGDDGWRLDKGININIDILTRIPEQQLIITVFPLHTWWTSTYLRGLSRPVASEALQWVNNLMLTVQQAEGRVSHH